ncbi:hypothetical protein MBANPS3_012698, partial [Mucor bainieri]
QNNVDIPSKKPSTIPKKDRKVSAPVAPRAPNPPIGPRVVAVKPKASTDKEPAASTQDQPESTKGVENGTENDKMNIDSPPNQPQLHQEEVTQPVNAAGAQTAENNNKQTEENGETLTGQELINKLIPDERMGETLDQERPELEDERNGKKPKTDNGEDEQGGNSTKRSTRGSAAS